MCIYICSFTVWSVNPVIQCTIWWHPIFNRSITCKISHVFFCENTDYETVCARVVRSLLFFSIFEFLRSTSFDHTTACQFTHFICDVFSWRISSLFVTNHHDLRCYKYFRCCESSVPWIYKHGPISATCRLHCLTAVKICAFWKKNHTVWVTNYCSDMNCSNLLQPVSSCVLFFLVYAQTRGVRSIQWDFLKPWFLHDLHGPELL